MHNVGNGSRSLVYDGKIAGLYDLEETLGSGHFAVVKLARHVFTGEKVAVKVIDKTKLDEVSRAHLFQEVRCMKLVQHPNVVRLYEVIDTQTKLYLILELGDGGDLYDYIMKHEGGLSENLAREYFRQIVRAISYCHKLHVVHRDLKPENVVFFEKLGVVKLTDFGFSNKFCPGQKLETSCGSLAYSAPEILLGDSYDAPAVDIWSLGVILYMLVCGNPPFEKANDSETLTMIMDCKYTMPAHVSQGCRKLIDSMLVRAPEKRATLEQIAQNAWLIEGVATQETTVPEFLPLVSRQQVSDDDHTNIIKKIVNGNIATKEEILEALDRNEYNHITATYFLMAERKLRQQRLDQLQKRRPDLSLPVSSTSQLSPRSRIQGIKNMQAARDANNQLLVPASNQLTAPRTPGAETTTGGRTRKCSIVQEEEDDEDEIPNCTKRDELLAPTNRRGSRSEGRINLAIQDKVGHQNERIKTKDQINSSIKYSQTKGIENISGIKVIHNDSNNLRMRLGSGGGAGGGCGIVNHNYHHRLINQQITPLPSPPIEITKPNDKSSELSNSNRQQNNSKIIPASIVINQPTEIDTKYLVDSSTITLPITSQTAPRNDSNKIPKYKTMPSPTRTNAILPGTRQLNEIFEEGTDIGSSDTSATTTPRPLTRSAHFTTNRGGGSNSSAAHHHHHHRRTKFHKTRTPSCSSSDASDDDSESRKKRAHKMPDISKPLQPQRRDSHDDSSDSQEPGNNASTSGNANLSSYLICTTGNDGGSGGSNNGGRNDGGSSSKGNNGGDGNSTTRDTTGQISVGSDSSSCQDDSFSSNELTTSQKTDAQQQQQQQQQQPLNYRRHRNGRRRASETRLRESQSLNRITEVQESEMPMNANHNINNQNSQSTNNTIQNNQSNDSTIVNINEDKILVAKQSQGIDKTIIIPPNINPIQTNLTTKSRGFSARLFQGFIRNKNNDSKNAIQQQQKQQQIVTSDPHSADDVDLVLGVEFTKAIRVTESTKSSSATKKLKMLGKYFQVHKKICIPLPGLFQRATSGRLYKAQSCGSIVHNRVNQNSIATTATTTPPINSLKSTTTTRHSVLFTTAGATTKSTSELTSSLTTITDDDGDGDNNKSNHSSSSNNKLLKTYNLGGAKFLNCSDSDINQNNDCNLKTINNISSSNNISAASLFLQQLSVVATTSSSPSALSLSPIITTPTSSLTQSQLLLSTLCSSPIQQKQQQHIQDHRQLSIATKLTPSTFDLMSSTSATMATTLLAAQNNSSSSSSNSNKINNSSNNISNNLLSNNSNNKIITSSSSSSPLHHQLNDVPLCSSKC